MEDEKPATKIPRTFMSKAWLKEEEPGVYQLYNNLLVEGTDPKTGEKVKEKVGKPFPRGRPLREAKKGEEAKVVVRTFHPTEMRPMELVEVDQ